jgi:ketosteroid isomerase-like protein
MDDAQSALLAANKQLTYDWLDATLNGDQARLRALMTDDCVFFVLGNSAIGGFPTHEELMRSNSAAMEQVPEVLMNIGYVTAEDDRVAVEAETHGRLSGGGAFHNHYHFLFRVRDGKIAAFKEYFDTSHVAGVTEAHDAGHEISPVSNLEGVLTHTVRRRT